MLICYVSTPLESSVNGGRYYLSVSPCSSWTPYGQGSSLLILEGSPCLLPGLDCTDLLQIQGNLKAEQTGQPQSPDGWSPFPASFFPSHTHSRVQIGGSGAVRGNGGWNPVGGSVLSVKQGLCLSPTRGMILQPKTKWIVAWSGGKGHLWRHGLGKEKEDSRIWMCGSDVPSALSATTPLPQTVCLYTLQSRHTSKFVNFYVYVFTKTRLHIIALNDNQCFYVLFLFCKKEFQISKDGDSEALPWSSSALLWPYLCITTERWKPHRHKKFY